MDRDFLADLFSDFGPVTIRPMFSGFGISVDGVNFAMALRAGLYFRADEQTIPQFEAEGSKPFQYQTSTRSVTVNSYWQLPARLFDDSEELSQWARAALGAAQRAALKKRKPAKQAAAQGRSKARKANAKHAKKPVKRKAAKTAWKAGSSRARGPARRR
ncbi:MAG: TfoX/Sxy family protein [Bradyrhizobium sp.]|uniref:TfoX/Sxy family protein n=1 Tax=Bradyrhizobium sp. TaxID=376 RepID=UPI001D1B82C9|nr:TfoX/Sxy family protein [Bradyrhizobium sp.]MBV9562743.1 TfoX/Sxy family protein [Bradyrhizobium sp.]